MILFRLLRDYEKFVYTIQEQFSCIKRSTLTIAQKSKRLSVLSGELIFEDGYRLKVAERLSMDSGLIIESYGYELWHGSDKIAWYDSQSHPDDPSLKSSHPHHKHIPPDIKHNRIPAPQLSFTKPNLPILIQEIDEIIQGELPSDKKKGDLLLFPGRRKT